VARFDRLRSSGAGWSTLQRKSRSRRVLSLAPASDLAALRPG